MRHRSKTPNPDPGTHLYDVGDEVRQRLVQLDLLGVLPDLILLSLQLVGDAHHLRLHDADLVIEEPRQAHDLLRVHTEHVLPH